MSFLDEVVDLTINSHDLTHGIRNGIIDAARQGRTCFSPDCIGDADAHWLQKNKFVLVYRDGRASITWHDAVSKKRKHWTSLYSV